MYTCFCFWFTFIPTLYVYEKRRSSIKDNLLLIGEQLREEDSDMEFEVSELGTKLLDPWLNWPSTLSRTIREKIRCDTNLLTQSYQYRGLPSEAICIIIASTIVDIQTCKSFISALAANTRTTREINDEQNETMFYRTVLRYKTYDSLHKYNTL